MKNSYDDFEPIFQKIYAEKARYAGYGNSPPFLDNDRVRVLIMATAHDAYWLAYKQAIKVVCEMCSYGLPVAESVASNSYFHRVNDNTVFCKASELWRIRNTCEYLTTEI